MSLAHVQDTLAFSVYGLALLPICPSGATVLSLASCAVTLHLLPLLRYLVFLFSRFRVYPLSTPCLPPA